uniref:Uncharacterized protein n=1 Tax=Physcomitrium patens TaxID=3218 RepID=A0A2K1JSX4_PHYPA|nr:hypothetical protein PHYPA_014412 [Physcomitrium patens]
MSLGCEEALGCVDGVLPEFLVCAPTNTAVAVIVVCADGGVVDVNRLGGLGVLWICADSCCRLD